MTKKLWIIVIPIIAVILTAIGILTYMLVSTPSTSGMYLEHIQNAKKLLENGDVDQAILMYQNAIKEDEKQDEPYLALADIYYENKNDLKMALDILFDGYGKTKSVTLKQAIDKYVALSESGELSAAGTENTSREKGVITNSYLDTFSSYTYQAYTGKYTIDKEHIGTESYTVSYKQIQAEFDYVNTPDHPNIVDKGTGKPYPNSRPTEIRILNLNELIGGIAEGVTEDDLRAGGAHDIHINNPGKGFASKYISFVYANCKCSIECDDNGVIKNPQAKNSIVPPMTVSETKATLAGRVLNADDNKLIKNAAVNIRSGKNKKTGSTVKELVTESGEFSLELDPGDYTVEIIADDFITDYFDCKLSEAGETVNQQFVLSPKLKDNQMRFVVEWTKPEYDLYIHIKGKSSTNENIQYWEYGHSSGNVSENIGGFETGSSNGQRYTSATITDSRGNYEFHVHGGKNQYSKDDLFKANVVVKVYKDNDSSPMVLNLPSSIPLDYWQVCTVHDGEITLIDK